jgi:hypothetical protein
MMGLAKSDCKPTGCGGCAEVEAGACASNTFKPFKCIIEKWSVTLGKLTELASVIGCVRSDVSFLTGFERLPANERRHVGRKSRSGHFIQTDYADFFDFNVWLSNFAGNSRA